jgi:hypothetical protein
MGIRIKNNGEGIKVARKESYLYYTKGDPIEIWRTRMQHKGRTRSKQPSELVLRTTIRRKQGSMYYIDSAGYLSYASMAHGRSRSRQKSKF